MSTTPNTPTLTLQGAIELARRARETVPQLIQPETSYVALVVIDDRRDELERELAECLEKNLWCNNEMLKLQRQLAEAVKRGDRYRDLLEECRYSIGGTIEETQFDMLKEELK